MKILLSSLALVAVMGVAYAQNPTNTSTQTTQTTITSVTTTQNPNSIAAVATKNSVNWEDASAAIAIGQNLNVDPSVIISQRPANSNMTIYQLAPAYMIANKSGKSVSDVYAMYSGGQTWVQIAGTLNVPATSWNPSNVDTTNWTNDDFDNGVWQAVLMQSYAMTPDDYTYLTQNKMPENELVVGTVLSRQDNTPVRTVMATYGTTKDWTAIDQEYANNISSPPNQSQATTPIVTPAPANPAVVTTPVPVTPAPTEQTQTIQTNTDQATTPATTGGGATGAVAETVAPSPVEEWQVNGGDINPYNGWAEQTTTSTYALHRRHHRHYRHVRRHIRHVLHHM